MLTLTDPVVKTYALAAGIMCFKMILQGWITVYQMLKAKGGYLHPEDLKKTPLNPNPDPAQLAPNPAVERSRAMQRNDTENVPAFLVAGLLFALTAPPLWAAQALLYGYVAARLLHFWALGTAQAHDVRATFYTIGSLITAGMAGYVIVSVLAR